MSSTLKFEPMHIPLAGGLNTKADPRALEPPGLTRCENAMFDKAGGIQKRPGGQAFTLSVEGGGTITATAVAGRGAERLAFAGGKIYSYSELTGTWIDRGAHYGCYVDQNVVSGDDEFIERAYIGNLLVFTSNSAFYIYDYTTRTLIGSRDLSAIGGSHVRAVAAAAHDGNIVRIYYWVSGSTAIRTIPIYASDPSASLTVSPVEYVTDTGTTGAFDVAADTDGDHLVVYENSGGNYGIIAVNNTDAMASAFTTTSKARAVAGRIAVHFYGASWSVARDNGTEIRYDQLDVNLADEVANLLVRTYATSGNRLTTVQLGGSGGSAYVLWEEQDEVWRGHVVNGSLSSAEVMVRHSHLATLAQIWFDNSVARPVVAITYVPYHADDTTNYQYILWDCNKTVNDGQFGVIARIHPGTGVGLTTIVGGVAQPTGRPQLQSSNLIAFPCVFQERTNTGEQLWFQRDIASSEALVYVNDPRAYDGVDVGGTLYLPGGYLAAYDGAECTEAGAFVHPHLDPGTAVTADTGGKLGVGIYYYRFYWEWLNARGERERSGYVENFLVGTAAWAGTDNKATITVPTCPYSAKSAYLVAYRTTLDPGVGAPFYRASVSTPSAGAIAAGAFVYNDTNADTVTWVDESTYGFSDTEIVKNETDYVSQGEVANLHVPFPPQFIASGQSRLFAVGALMPTTVFASKIRFDGDVIAFDAAESFKFQTPSRGGRVTALLPREDAVVAFSERAIALIGGIGPSNTGDGGWDIPGLLDETIGCTEARAMGVVPGGALFFNSRGAYVIDSSLQIQYIGGPIDDYRTRAVRGIVAMEDVHRVLVATTTGTLLFDTAVQQWSDWQGTPWSASDIAVANGEVYTVAGGAIYELDETSFLDGATPYSLVVETAWFKFGGILGYQKARFWEFLGEYRAAHELRIKIGYNFESEWVDDLTWSVPAVDAGEPERPRGRFSYMKSPAVRFLIQDDNRGATVRGESVRLTALSVEVAVKGGLARVPQNDMVGP